jgi:tetratricopeptide (TPR) repeat protein
MSWDDAVATYRRAPSDESFQRMIAVHERGKTPALSEVIYPIAVPQNVLMFMRHLTIALLCDGRFLEASYFADRWLAFDPQSLEALSHKGIICVERGELREAIGYYEQLGALNPASLEVVRLRLMLYLRLNQTANAQQHALALLRFPRLTPPDILLLAEIGVRARDAALVAAAVHRRGTASFSQRAEHELRDIARLGLLQTIDARLRVL